MSGLTIANFFAPHSLFNLAELVLVVLILDTVGSVVASVFHFPKFLRLTHWIIGTGVWVSLWFGLHFFLPFWPQLVWLSLLGLGLIAVPYYLRNRLYLGFRCEFFWIVLAVISFSSFLKPIFYLTALPPRVWDDMAYHLYSPNRLMSELQWNFTSEHVQGWSFYMMMPRWLDTTFILFFATTKTYASAQLVHFGLFFTSLITMARFVREKIGWMAAAVFVYLAMGLNTELLRSTTAGYVDAGAAALNCLVFISLMHASVAKNRGSWLAAAALSGLAVGVKYTNIVLVMTSWLSAGSFSAFPLSDFFKHVRSRIWWKSAVVTVVSILLVSTFFGGYWYIKNLLLAHNPVYPFVFGCNGCPEEHALEEWGYLEFTSQNQVKILETVFYTHPELYIVLSFSLGLAFWLALQMKKKYRLVILMAMLVSVLLEILLHSWFSLFALRFFFHWLLLIPLGLSLPLHWPSQSTSLKPWTVLSVWLLFVSVLLFQVKPLIAEQKLVFSDMSKIAPYNQYYVRGQIGFTEWLESLLPHTSSLVEWCGQAHSESVELYSFDPEVIWNYYGLSRIFFVNCRLHILPLPPVESDLAAFVSQFRAEHRGEYVWSVQACGAPDISYPDTIKPTYATLNQLVVCSATQVTPNMYQVQ